MSLPKVKNSENNTTHNSSITTPINREQIPVREMNVLLADLHLHYQALRNFHWNVAGENFFTLHQVFESQYNTIKVKIDILAERIKMIGFQPIAKYQTYLEESNLTEPEVPEQSRDMVAFLVLNIRTMQRQFQNAINDAAKAGDSVTEDLLIGIKSVLDKQDWMLSSFLK